MKIFRLVAMLALSLITVVAAFAEEPAPAQPSVTMPLWPKGQMPGKGPDGVERELPSRGDKVIRLTDIHEPSFAVFKAPATGKATPAVIVCPGGGYGALAYNKEGTEVAAWLNSIGITGVVLKYRVPNNRDGAFQDIQRAVRLVRQNAAAWNISAEHIGVMGFSAGGHLCARLSTNWEQPSYSKLDAADEHKTRPDFTALVYPAYLAQASGEIAKGFPVDAKTPPTFLAHAEDDKSFIAGSKAYHAALEAAKVPNHFFLCAKGGHGHGLRSQEEVRVWPEKFGEWLVKAGIR